MHLSSYLRVRILAYIRFSQQIQSPGPAPFQRVVAARLDIPVEEANTIVATACDIVNCALYGLGENYIPQDRGRLPYDMAIVAVLPKSIFADGI